MILITKIYTMTKQELLELIQQKGITELELIDKTIKKGDVAEMKHVYRALLVNQCGMSIQQVAEDTMCGVQAVKSSLKKYNKELADSLKPVEIMRHTDDEFDERFYEHPTKINPRTGLKFFPAFHFVLGLGAPTAYHLIEYYKDKNHYADTHMKQRERIGTFVHDAAEHMVKSGIEITEDQIVQSFSNAYDRRDVKKGLTGFVNFCTEYQPIIISTEQMILAEDWAGTMDLRCRLNVDDYKTIWTIDYKTSKAVYDDHKMQVEMYRSVTGDDRCAVLILGNTTKKMFTFSEVKEKDRQYYHDRFNSIKETAYVEMLKSGQIKPRENIYADKFSIKHLNLRYES